MEISWTGILGGVVAYLLTLIIKNLLDFKLAQFIVKFLSFIPVRNFFREKPITVKGRWEQTWGSAGSKNFEKSIDRHSHPIIKQLGSYCYAEFISKKITYVIFGRIVGNYLIGDWYDKADPQGYFGTFHLQILDGKNMKGQWIGHSKTEFKVKGDEWIWKKLD